MNQVPTRIFKYKIAKHGVATVRMPMFSRVLSVGVIEDEIFIWVAVKEDMPETNRKIVSRWTGAELDSGETFGFSTFVGTVQCEGFVVHVFDHGDVGNRLGEG
jgi:hypothetical protein